MSKPIEGKPAFPNPCDGLESSVPGLSERRYYIGQALAGLCANPNFSQAPVGQLAHMAIEEADNLMSMLYPQPKEPKQ